MRNLEMAPTTVKSSYDPETARALRLEFERLAQRVERTSANKIYRICFKKVARMIRDAKPD